MGKLDFNEAHIHMMLIKNRAITLNSKITWWRVLYDAAHEGTETLSDYRHKRTNRDDVKQKLVSVTKSLRKLIKKVP